MRLTAFMVLMLCLATADARDIYRWVAPDGSEHYSDTPHTGAERITLPEWSPPQPRRYVLPPSPGATGKSMFTVYNRLTIVRPKLGENIWDNQGVVGVTITVEPNLNTAEDHKIQILLDGQVQEDPSPSLDHSLRGVERGRHTVAAQVINKRGRVLISSRPVSFYSKQASPLFHQPRPGTPKRGVQQAPRAPMAPQAPRAPHAPFRPAVTPPPPQSGSM